MYLRIVEEKNYFWRAKGKYEKSWKKEEKGKKKGRWKEEGHLLHKRGKKKGKRCANSKYKCIYPGRGKNFILRQDREKTQAWLSD